MDKQQIKMVRLTLIIISLILLLFFIIQTQNGHWLWNGALFFLNASGSNPDSQTDIAKTVSFKPNRAVYFSANMCHYAEAPSNIFKDLRVSIAWKLSKYL